MLGLKLNHETELFAYCKIDYIQIYGTSHSNACILHPVDELPTLEDREWKEKYEFTLSIYN